MAHTRGKRRPRTGRPREGAVADERVKEWLAGIGLSQYAVLFARSEIDTEVLPALGEQDLEKLGIPLGHRKKLLKAIAALSAAQQAVQTLPQTSRVNASEAGEHRWVDLLRVRIRLRLVEDGG
ncbi:MAG: SAM domain-containing protein [Terriglobales bacterium]